ncbi:GntR family transcriptional regulator [Companilactobacillus zhachilii]|uniref:GntR family transcriptional regulator n=1 Tax=Companilactobacillus zhachilii TaxID=2304606 RepID=A0A386PUM3_9LACO|nr:GntR family transcriptional regulator [Companilactobacillus zhachilii]AYE38868.1 GntR family transcriptional regulator [Companilactobacillus zhachilii]MBL3531446.1 GntR family transcriptional regulator [Companilactobacillus zhachilii]
MKINLQQQLVNRLTDYLETLPTNAKLPSERQLADKYEVSRNTVRAALLSLEAIGLVRRMHGKGTFVNRTNLNSDLSSSYKFGEQMKLLGKVPTTKIVSFEKREVNAYFADNMNLAFGEFVIKVERLRLADGEPMLFERTYLPLKFFPTLTMEMLENKSLYDIFEQDFQEDVSYADEYFSSGVISDCDSKVMGLPEGMPCLLLKRKTYDLKQRMIEFTLSTARSDEFAYHVRHNIED